MSGASANDNARPEWVTCTRCRRSLTTGLKGGRRRRIHLCPHGKKCRPRSSGEYCRLCLDQGVLEGLGKP